MRFKGILIDLGDTLTYIDKTQDRNQKEKVLAILQQHGFEINFDELSATMDAAFWNSTRGDDEDTYSYWKSLLTRLTIQAAPDLILELEEFWNTNVHKTVKYYDNVIPTLTYLKKKYQLALVSNCAVGTRGLLQRLSLSQFFECIILSYELKTRKPNHKMYLKALDCLKLNAEDCLFVADEISDLEGAKEVGLKTLLIHQGGHPWDEAADLNFKPDYEYNTFAEIMKLL